MDDPRERWRRHVAHATGDGTGHTRARSGLDVAGAYFAGDVPEGVGAELPGAPPFTRGLHPTMYAGRPWTIRQYAGFSTARDTNRFFRDALAAGQTGLSVAFDLATHRGYDSDHPRVVADVGKAGVAVDTVEDMKRLFEGIPLGETSVSMTMNGAVLPVMAMFIVAAEEQGVAPATLAGTIQNDILKEFLVRNTYIYPPDASMRIVGDVMAYATAHMPRFNPISISGYHMHEAGATPVQELAFTLADGLEYVRCAVSRGLDVDAVGARLSFFFAIGMDFFAEIAKLRAARQLWHDIMTELGATDPRAKMLRVHCQTSGVSLTEQDPHNNVVRTAFEAMAAVLGGTQSLHTNAFDEAIALPGDGAARLARNTQLILAHETGITGVADPLGGSYYVEALTGQMIDKARALMAEVAARGGMVQAIGDGSAKAAIDVSAIRRQAEIDRGEAVIVGVNRFRLENEAAIAVRDIDTRRVREEQIADLAAIRERRDAGRCESALAALREYAAMDEGNLLEAAIEAARARASVGEISDALAYVFGRYEAEPKVSPGVYAEAYAGDAQFEEAQRRVAAFADAHHRAPVILISKLGQDGHDRGAKVIAAALTDLGFSVHLGPLFATPQEAAAQAEALNVDAIGVSSLAAGHKTLVPDLMSGLRARDLADVAVFVGGVIPAEDHGFLRACGVAEIFGPGSNVLDTALAVLGRIEGRLRNR